MKKPDSVLKDLRKTRRVLRMLCGLRVIRKGNFINAYNLIYIVLTYIFLAIVILQGIILAYLTENLVEKVEAIHYTLIIIVVIAYINNELYNDSKLEEAWKLLNFAYDNFNDHEEADKKVHKDICRNVSRSNAVFCFLMTTSSVGYMLFAPTRQVLSSGWGGLRKLPVPLYVPFPTDQALGYAAGMVWEAITLCYICGVATSVHQSYRGIMGLLLGELKLLNRSLNSIQERADKKYKQCVEKSRDIFLVANTDQFMSSMAYQCLREDIIHHQILIKYYNLTKDYLGSILLLFIALSSIILATVCFLITRPTSQIEDIIKFVAIVSAELFFVYQLCWEGELVAKESGETFHTAFGIPWYNYDKKFRLALSIMLCRTMKVIRLHTNLFNIPASLETYNSVVTTAFQYFNILRNI